MASMRCQEREASVTSWRNNSNDFNSSENVIQEKQNTEERSVYAKEAAKVEREMSIFQSIVVFKWGVVCAVLLALACVMEGYSLVLVTSFFEVDKFLHDYNSKCSTDLNQRCELPASWQTMLVDIPMVGQMIGIALNGWATDRFGYRLTFIVAVTAAAAFNFLNFFSSASLPLFLVGQTLTGIPYGVFQVLAATYASDVVPNRIRGIFSSMINLDWIIGQVLASAVMAGLQKSASSAAYKVPLALTWIFPIPIIAAALLAPESPWWLIRKGRIPEARKAIEKIASGRKHDKNYDAGKHLILMQETNEEEMRTNGSGKESASMTYFDCFKGVNLRRTEIACCTWAAQNLVGPALMNYSTYFLTNSGVNKDIAFKISIGQYCIGILANVGSWWLMPALGRRTILFGGQIGLFSILVLIGIFSVSGLDQSSIGIATATLLLLFSAVYQSTVGPITYPIVNEMPSTRLKAKTVSLARFTYVGVSLFNGGIMPQMINTEHWHWGAKTAWFWAVITALCALYTFFRVPETKGLSFEEIDMAFSAKTPARKFKACAEEIRAEREHGLLSASSSSAFGDSHFQQVSTLGEEDGPRTTKRCNNWRQPNVEHVEELSIRVVPEEVMIHDGYMDRPLLPFRFPAPIIELDAPTTTTASSNMGPTSSTASNHGAHTKKA